MQHNQKINIIMLVILLAAVMLAFLGYKNSHNQYAGRYVYKSCFGGYIPATETSSTQNNAGGPCRMGDAFILQNNQKPYVLSTFVLGAVAGSELTFVVIQNNYTKRLRSKKKK